MITRVTLKNFQVHRALTLELGSFTVLSGQSNGGKSAVLRALAAMLRNDSVADYVTHGQSNLMVEVELRDGHVVRWDKGKSKNDYTLTRPDGTVSEYKKVGASVPEEVSDLLRIGPIVMEDGTKVHLNLHEQQESPFLLMDSAGYVAKVFGELTSAGKLFSAASEGNRRTREEKKLRTLREADISSARAELTQYEHLAEARDAIETVTAAVETAKKLKAAAEAVGLHLTDHSNATSDLGRVEQSISECEGPAKVDVETISKLNTAAVQLSGLISDLRTSASAVLQVEAALPALERRAGADLSALEAASGEVQALRVLLTSRGELEASLDALPGAGEPAEIDIETISKLNNAIVAVLKLRREHREATTAHDHLGEAVKAAQSELAEAEHLLSEVDTCPLCNQEISGEAAEHMAGATHE